MWYLMLEGGLGRGGPTREVSAFGGGLEVPQAAVGVTHGHLAGAIVGVLERGDDLDGGTGADPVRFCRLEHEPYPGLLVRGDLGDEDVRAVAVAELAGVMAGVELELIAELGEELGRLAPVVRLQEHGLDALGAHVSSPLQLVAAPRRECR